MKTREMGSSNASVAQSLNDLGMVMLHQVDTAGAEECFSKALGIMNEEAHLQTARNLDNLEMLMWQLQNYRSAEDYHRKALAVRLQAVCDEHPAMGEITANLALAIYYQGRLSEAEEYHHKPLTIWEEALGNGHPDVQEKQLGIRAGFSRLRSAKRGLWPSANSP